MLPVNFSRSRRNFYEIKKKKQKKRQKKKTQTYVDYLYSRFYLITKHYGAEVRGMSAGRRRVADRMLGPGMEVEPQVGAVVAGNTDVMLLPRGPVLHHCHVGIVSF